MSGDTQDQVWPLPKFNFSVDFGDGVAASFAEVSGLDAEAQIIEYRAGGSQIFSPIKMPGLAKSSNVTLKRGVFPASSDLWTWFNTVTMNTVTRRTVVVNLLDESGAPAMSWTLANAYPTKVSGTDLKSDGNDVAVESIELACETITASAR